jgi:hypothetical protein
VAEAIRRHLVPVAKLEELQALIEENRRREVDLKPAMTGEAAMLYRAVEALDRRLGLYRFPLRLWWGRGAVQVEQLEEDWKAGRPAPSDEELEKMHPAVRFLRPDVEAAARRLRERNAAQLGVLVAMRLEREHQAAGRYPAVMPEGLIEPLSGKPWVLVSKADQVMLYGMGEDKTDDGGHPEKDLVIWGPIAPAKSP